jgi:hypothetical protein
MQPKHSQERRPPYLPTGLPHGQHHGRTMSARRYLELGRQPRLSPWPARRPPYLEAVATAAVFIFLLYVILGGV